MPTNIPRTQTGLVPTTYQNKLNRICSPENWRRLPPRPAPERYQFRGCAKKETISSRANGKKDTQIKLQNRKTCKSRECERTGERTSQAARKNVLPWDDCMRDVTAHLNKETNKSSKDSTSLDYIRKSGRKRRQLRDLQKRLDGEIEEENRLYGLDEKCPRAGGAFWCSEQNKTKRDKSDYKMTHRSHRRDDCDNQGETNNLIDEMNRIKASLLNRVEYGCNSHSGESAEDGEGSITNSSDKDQTRRNHTRQYIIQYSLGDASTLNSLESSNSSFTVPSSHEHVHIYLPTMRQKSVVAYDGVTSDLLHEKNLSDGRLIAQQYEKFLPSSDEDMYPRGTADHSLSTTSTWDDLSHDQHERIKLRAEELYRSKYKPRISTIEDNTQGIEDNNDIRGNELALQPSEPFVSQQYSTERDTIKESDNFCVKSLVAAITKGLCSDPSPTIDNNVRDVGENEESTTSVEDIHDYRQVGCTVSTKVLEEMPLPRHPYELPLEKQFRKAMKNNDKKLAI